MKLFDWLLEGTQKKFPEIPEKIIRKEVEVAMEKGDIIDEIINLIFSSCQKWYEENGDIVNIPRGVKFAHLEK